MEKKLNNKDVFISAILEVLAFFDIFDFPLTAFEIRKYLRVPCSLSTLNDFLDAPNRDQRIGYDNGFYFLAGREGIIAIRGSRYAAAARKMRVALRAASVFSYLPWIKFVALGNIMGPHNGKEASDIDLVIVTARNRIWLVRFFCVLISKFMGWRPNERSVRDKICLSFFLAENVGLGKTMLQKSPESTSFTYPLDSDPYFVYWTALLIPLFWDRSFFLKWDEQADWLRERFPNLSIGFDGYFPARNLMKKTISAFFRIFFWPFESYARAIQLKVMPSRLKCAANLDTRVMTGKDILKFHLNDRRDEYRNLFYRKFWELDKNRSPI